VLPLSLVRGMDKLWRVAMPEGDLGKLQNGLLARSGGCLPPPDDFKRWAIARDAIRSFAVGFQDWDGSGRAQVLDTLELSGLSDATRAYEGELAAAYLNEAMDRIGQIVPQRFRTIRKAGRPTPCSVIQPAAWCSHPRRPDPAARPPGAEATTGTLDEIVVSLVMGACKLVLLAGGLLFIAQALSLPYESVVAGLGIGGLAVAFASRETLSNVFGAGILVADRPFRRGDWIEAGDARGTVEHVGIRSTRIRTGDDSLLIVPNGKLADAAVNNLGTRRHRVIKAKLLVMHPVAPNALTAFMDGLLAFTAEVPHVRPGSAAAGLTSIESDGVELSCLLDVRTLDNERTDRTVLMLGVRRAASG